MSKLTFILGCLFLFGVAAPAQKPASTDQTNQPQPVEKQVAGRVPDAGRLTDLEWREISRAFEVEDWEKLSALTTNSLKMLKTENEAKQLARLRYLYLYSLAGKVSQGKATNAELDASLDSFVGQDFLMPSREVAANCQNKLNFICPSKNKDNVLRVTTINKPATMILSFEYVSLPASFDFAVNKGKKIFLGGKLKNAELNSDETKTWIMRLYFEKGTEYCCETASIPK